MGGPSNFQGVLEIPDLFKESGVRHRPHGNAGYHRSTFRLAYRNLPALPASKEQHMPRQPSPPHDMETSKTTDLQEVKLTYKPIYEPDCCVLTTHLQVP